MSAKKSKMGQAHYLDYLDFDGDGKITGKDVTAFLEKKRKRTP